MARPKGTPNRISGQLREMILTALEDSGGVSYLQRQADEQPAAFLALIGKILPSEITGAGGGDITIVVRTGVPEPTGDASPTAQ